MRRQRGNFMRSKSGYFLKSAPTLFRRRLIVVVHYFVSQFPAVLAIFGLCCRSTIAATKPLDNRLHILARRRIIAFTHQPSRRAFKDCGQCDDLIG